MSENRRVYTADMIKVVSAPEAIRRSPATYAGPVEDPLTVNRLFQESLCLALDAACGGKCTRIDVTLHRNGSATVADDRPGQSLKRLAAGRTEAERLLTELFACRDRQVDGRVREAACGIGIVVMNALREWGVLTTTRDGGRCGQQ